MVMGVKIILVLILIFSDPFAAAVSNVSKRSKEISSKSTHTDRGGKLWIQSVMLSHTLHWEPPEGSSEQNTFTVEYTSISDNFTEVTSCTEIKQNTCDLTTVLPLIHVLYTIQVTMTNNSLATMTNNSLATVLWKRSLQFQAEFETTLITPNFTAHRFNDVIIITVEKSLDRGNNESISERLCYLKYQVKYWKDTEVENKAKFMSATMAHIKDGALNIQDVEMNSGYCFKLRIWNADDEYKIEHNGTMASTWSDKHCLNQLNKPVNQTGVAFAIAAVLASLLIAAFAIKMTYKMWSIWKIPKTPPKILDEVLKDVPNYIKPEKLYEHVDLFVPCKNLPDNHEVIFNSNCEKYNENPASCEILSSADAAKNSSQEGAVDDETRSKSRYHSVSTTKIDKSNDDNNNNKQTTSSSPYSPHFTGNSQQQWSESSGEDARHRWVSGDSPYSSVFLHSTEDFYKSLRGFNDDNVTKDASAMMTSYRRFGNIDSVGGTASRSQSFSAPSNRVDSSPSLLLSDVSGCSYLSDTKLSLTDFKLLCDSKKS